MKVGTTTGLFTKAATGRIICPAQACRQQRFTDDYSRRSQTRTICSSSPDSLRRPSIRRSGSSPLRIPQKRVSTAIVSYHLRPLTYASNRPSTQARTYKQRKILTIRLVWARAHLPQRSRRRITVWPKSSTQTRIRTRQQRTNLQRHSPHMSF